MPTISGFLGMRGTGDWATDERPKNWRQGILRLYPNGTAPLTAILSKMGEEKVDDPEFNWWTKSLPTQGGAVASIYTDVAMSAALGAGAATAAAVTLFAKVTAAVAKEFRVGHQALLRYSSDPTMDVNVKVIGVQVNGASSCITCKLLEADDNSIVSGNDLAKCNSILINGNINPEGGSMPNAVAYDPVKLTNYTQIFRTPLDMTRTAMKTKLRTEDAYKEAKREALEMHSIEMEKAFIFGVATEGTGSNGKPERTTAGIISMIRANASANVANFTLDSAYAGKTWVDAGEEWLDTYLEILFRYGGSEKFCLAGSGAILGLNRLIKSKGTFDFTPATKSYGIQVVEWTTPFGKISMKTHPLFSYNSADRNSILLLEPRLLKYRYVDDTEFYPDKSSGVGRVDGKSEEFLTECGLEYHYPDAFGYLSGVGLNNELT
jgi:hypothetical protein